jgi:beta-glucosidase
VTFTVVAVDDTDPAPVVLASVDDDELTPSPGSFVVSGDGVHTVMIRAVDASGNGGKIIVRTIRIDSIAPTVAAARTGDHRLALSATDATSGVASIEYRYVLTVRNRSYPTGWRSYTAPIPAFGGRLITVEYRATDVAGTTSAVGVFR